MAASVSLQKIVDDSRKLDDLSKNLESINSGITIHNVGDMKQKLEPLVQEFQSYSYMSTLPKGSMAFQSYEFVKGLVERIPEQLKRLSGIQHRTTIDLQMCGEVTQDPSTSPSQSLTLNWPGKEQELANRVSLISVDSRSATPKNGAPIVIAPSTGAAPTPLPQGCCVIQ